MTAAPASLDQHLNPYARRAAAVRYQILEALGPIVHKLGAMAANGNLGAARLLLNYGLGKPPAALDPDRLDLHECELFEAAARTADSLLRTGSCQETPGKDKPPSPTASNGARPPQAKPERGTPRDVPGRDILSAGNNALTDPATLSVVNLPPKR